ncbi:MAG: FAD-binding oxidoreductase [Rhodobacteraceae bacterium]|nr:FAD-binding oxidoreductase [Paracoccaceae bacterium]
MTIADVTVMGAGIFGLAIGWECARRGARVTVIERDRIGAGASGGIVGALAPHVPEQWNPKKAFQLDSLTMAGRFWATVAEASGRDPGYARLGRVQPLANEAAVELARARAEGARGLWRGSAEWRVVPASNDGWQPPSASGWIVEDTLSARLHPRQAVTALAGAIRAKEGMVHEAASEPRAGVCEPGGNAVVIWATGVQGLADLSAAFARPVGGGVKGQAALFACDAAGRPQIFADALHVVPHGDGTVAVGSTSERDYTSAGDTDARLEALIEKARALCPALRGAPVIERWAGLRPRAKSRAPVLGAWPGRPGHFVANGGFKIGFGMAPKVAAAMADLALDGHDTIPAGFRVEDSL